MLQARKELSIIKKIILVIIGILFVGLSIFFFLNGTRYSSVTTGTVVDVVENKVHNSKKCYPIIKYKVKNKIIKKQSIDSTTNINHYKKGDKITVYYDKNNVSKFTLDKKTNINTLVCCFVFMTFGICSIISVVFFDNKSESLFEILSELLIGLAHFRT